MTRCGVDDETCGRHSAIPPCCRVWFAVWQAFHESPASEGHLLGNPIIRARWNYVACPGCRHCGAKVVPRECACPLVLPRRNGMTQLSVRELLEEDV